MTTDGGNDYLRRDRGQVPGNVHTFAIPLAGAMERVSNVVKASSCWVSVLRCLSVRSWTTHRVPGDNYSRLDERSPQVTANGQHRFYGRGPGGNVILTQGDIDRL